MSQKIRKIRLLISSPGDVQTEREKLREVINELNYVLGKQLNFVIEPVGWETHCYPALGRPQEVINKQIGSYDIFVGIMWKRFGTPTGEVASGTEEEFRIAFREWEKDKTLKILFYFSQASYTPKSQDELSQHSNVLKFREELTTKGLVWEYPSPEIFPTIIRKHLSDVIWDIFQPEGLSIPEQLSQIQEKLNTDNPHYRVVANTDGRYEIVAKHPNANIEAPLTVSISFESPHTEKGRELSEGLQRSLKTGEPITITEPFIKEIRLPDIISSVLDPSLLKVKSVTTGANTFLPPLLAKAIFEGANGETFVLDYIHFEKDLKYDSGRLAEFTLTNTGQPVPWNLQLSFLLKEKQLLFNYHVTYEGLNVKQELDALRLQQAIARGGIFKIEDISTGFELPQISFPLGKFSSPDPDYVRVIEKLVFIQQKAVTLLKVPDSENGDYRKISKDQAEAIFETAQILETGRASHNVSSWQTEADKESAQRLVEEFGNIEPKSFGMSFEEERTDILGTTISLGPVYFICEKSLISLTDLEQIKASIDNASNEEKITVRFTPFENCPMITLYPKWMPPDERVQFLAQFPKPKPESTDSRDKGDTHA